MGEVRLRRRPSWAIIRNAIMQIVPGTRVGPYEIISPIGAGGMGEVWKARDTRLERNVAIKVLPAGFASNPELRARFQREARVISSFAHPHVCTLFDVGSENGVDYLVMELLEGETLADRLARGPLPVAETLKYGAQIAEALDRAHRAGIVHRDLKPGNVMLTRGGAKLLDFGLAKSSGAVSLDAAAATEHKPLTQEGSILGTFQYMAPEQLEGEEADARTDIFALGAVLYEMLTGKRAFEGKTRTSLIAAIVDRDPAPVSQVQPLTPPALEHVIRRCLEKDRDTRWQSAHDVAEELRWIGQTGSQTGAAPPHLARKKTRERLLWLALVVAAAATAAALTWTQLRRPVVSQYRFAVPMDGAGYKYGRYPLTSPDGRQIVFRAQNASGVHQVFLRRLDDFEARPIPGTAGFFHLCWSPDSRSVLFLSEEDLKLRRVDVGGSDAPEVVSDTPTPAVRDAAWSPSGDILLGQEEGPLLRIAPTDRKPVPITKLDASRFERGHLLVHFLPDGRRFLFSTFTRDPSNPAASNGLYAGSLDSDEVTRIGDTTSGVSYARGFLFFVREGSLFAQPFDERALRFTGAAVKVIDDVNYFQPRGNASFSVARDGTVVVAADPSPERLTIVDGKGTTIRTIGEPGRYGSAFVSRDGSSVFIARRDRRIGTFDIWQFGLLRDTAARVTFEPSWENRPVLSPDGVHLYYASDVRGVPDIYVKKLDGSAADRVLLEAPGEQTPTDVSVDGKYLLYQDNHRGARDLWLLPLAGGRPIPFVRTDADDAFGRISPDGKSVAYTSNISGRSEIYIKPFLAPGAPRQVSTTNGQTPRWSADGRTLYFINAADDRTIYSVSGFDAASEPALLFKSPTTLSTFETLPNGQFLLWSVDDDAASPPARVIVRWPDTVKSE